MAAEVLGYVASQPDGVALKDSIDFASDSLFCEWAYVVDLDKRTFEVFEGFNKTPIGGEERFASFFKKVDHREDQQYYPVRMILQYSLDHLPCLDAFLLDVHKACRKEAE